jgi:hypothetical protein
MAATSYIASTTVGRREDLSDIIAVVDAKETTLTSSIKKGSKKPSNAYVEWLVDSYPSTSTAGTVDGTEVSYSSAADFASTRYRIGTYIQQFRRIPGVSRLEEVVATVAGINNPDPQGVAGATEFARAKAKATVMVKRDIEATFLSANSAVADDGTNAYQTRGLGKWLSASADSPALGQSNVLLSSSQIYSGNLSAFTEDSLRGVLQQRWSVTGKGGDLLGIVGSSIKNSVSDFSRYLPAKTISSSTASSVRFYNQDVASKQITTSVDIYSGDYGNIELHLSAFVPNTRTGYIIDPEFVEMRTHTAPYFTELPDLGAGRRGIVEAIVALVPTNPTAHAKIVAADA